MHVELYTEVYANELDKAIEAYLSTLRSEEGSFYAYTEINDKLPKGMPQAYACYFEEASEETKEANRQYLLEKDKARK